MPEPPHHLDRPIALVTHHIHRPQIGKRHRDIVSLFLVTGKNQDRVTPLLMVNKVLPVSVMLRRIRLGLPVHELPADGVIGIHGARRELLFGLLKGDQQHIGLDVSEVE